ncbi:barstar family protein [Psychrobacter sp. F1192]|uniref:Barstar family protein n=1 Tax=Psychrobacter coccoides TaxID=2818440 RepID=A0ABS3NLS1_9GAMM|nr:barstar family protein [Psychrobacter coccoides]MBO1530362.1 barstar family protein [Psychrobacter coccoides]
MSQAIHYIGQNDVNQKATTPNARVPQQAVNIPVGEILDKQTLLTALAEACHFPSYFAHNWDSAWDCLTDSEVTDLTLNITTIECINTEDFNVFKTIIEDAYRDFGKPQLWVIVPPANDA